MIVAANLRINADDFGLSPQVSRAITRAAQDGLINSLSVVPFDDAESLHLLRSLAREPALRMGAHLTFIEVPLLTRPASFPQGLPPASYRRFLPEYLRGRIRRADVAREWKAQVELLRQRIAPTPIHHLDSHQHLHLLPGLWGVAKRLQKELRVPFLRCPSEPTWRAWRKDFPLGAGLQALAGWHRGGACERFFGVGTSMGFKAEAYLGLARELIAHPEQAYELMVHLGEDRRGQEEARELRRWLEHLEAVSLFNRESRSPGSSIARRSRPHH